MRIITFLIFVCALNVSATGFSQEKLTLNLKKVKLTTVFSIIQQKTDYRFIYNNEDVNRAPLINISVKKATVPEILRDCFKDYPMGYRIENRTVVVKKEKVNYDANPTVKARNLEEERAKNFTKKKNYNSILSFQELRRVEFELNGRVTDEDGNSLSGVSVTLKGTSIGTTTDEDGNYSLVLENGNGVLVFSSVAFFTQEIPIRGKKVINVILKISTSSLEDVVVVGYGTQKKSDLTGAISVVNVKDALKQPSSSITESLQGKAAGVDIVNDGSPGATPQIRIRGYSTINDNNPLYIIDGVPYQGNLSWLNQNDIKTIQILKDASSASIYGSRANNGVIIITTITGTSEKFKLNLNSYVGQSIPIRNRFPKFLSPIQYAQYLFSANRNAGLNPSASVGIMYGNGTEPDLPEYLIAGMTVGMNVTTEDSDPSKYNSDPNNFYQITKANQQGTDWMRAITNNATVQNYELSASGSDKNLVYSFSMGYLNQKGTVKHTGFKRYNIRSNSQLNLFNNHVRIGENMLFSRSEGVGFATNVTEAGDYQGVYSPVADVYKIQPIIPLYDIMGNFAGARGATLGDAKNPLALLFRGKDNFTNENRFFGSVFGETSFLKDFTFRTTLGVNLSNSNGQTIRYPAMEDAVSISTNGYTAEQGFRTEWTWTNTLQFQREINRDNLVKLLAGTEVVRQSYRFLSGSRDGYFILGDQNYYYLSTGSSNIQNNEVGARSALFSEFGRLDYSFKERYLFSSTIRRDGSSSFGPFNRYGVFPAFSVAWRISDESFMKKEEWINSLKIRIGYGETGNQNIPANNAFDLFSPAIATGSYAMSNSGSLSTGISQSQVGNPALKWERLRSTNLGLDFMLFNGSIDGSIDIYRRITSDMLFSVPLPSQQGGMASSPFQNVGSMKNQGIELSLNYHSYSKGGKTISWNSGVTLAHNSNIVTELAPGIVRTVYGVPDLSSTTILEKGKPYGEFFGYRQAGIFQDEREVENSGQPGARVGGIKYEDVDGDGLITPDDRTYLGSPLPNLTIGLYFNATYNNFDLSFSLYSSLGNKVFNEPKLFSDFQEFPSAASVRLLDAWSVDNKNSLIPSPSASSSTLEYQSSSYYIENGSYLRLRNVQIGYTFPKLLSQIKSIRTYLSVTNLFTITKYLGMDPEVTQYKTTIGLPGMDLGVYPTPRQFLLGINIEF